MMNKVKLRLRLRNGRDRIGNYIKGNRVFTFRTFRNFNYLIWLNFFCVIASNGNHHLPLRTLILPHSPHCLYFLNFFPPLKKFYVKFTIYPQCLYTEKLKSATISAICPNLHLAQSHPPALFQLKILLSQLPYESQNLYFRFRFP